MKDYPGQLTLSYTAKACLAAGNFFSLSPSLSLSLWSIEILAVELARERSPSRLIAATLSSRLVSSRLAAIPRRHDSTNSNRETVR